MTSIEMLKENHKLLEEKLPDEVIPFVVQRTSELYGIYNLVLVGIDVNINGMIHKSSELYNQLKDLNRMTIVLQEFSDEVITKSKEINMNIELLFGGAIRGTYISLKEYNEDWKIKNPECDYLKQYPRVKNLPVINYSEKQMLKFLEKNDNLIKELINEI